jgi:hypothetical protein
MIFDQVPTDRIVVALKGTDRNFRELILSALASRVRRVAEHELAIGDPSNQRDVLEARRVITDLALDLAERGEIELNPEQGMRWSFADRSTAWQIHPIRRAKQKSRPRRRYATLSSRERFGFPGGFRLRFDGGLDGDSGVPDRPRRPGACPHLAGSS